MSTPRVSIKKVLISDACDPGCAALLEKNGIEVQSKYKLPTDALIAELKVIFFNEKFILLINIILGLKKHNIVFILREYLQL